MKKIIRTLLAFVRLILLVMLTILTVLVALPCFYISGCSRKVSYATAKSWGRVALFILNVKVKLQGKRPKEKVLVMPNHQNYIDIFLVLAYYPASIVAKKEIGQWPILCSAIKLGRIILVDRASLKGNIATMRKIAEEINGGGSVILFPEGTTCKGPLTSKFRSGSFKIAEETKTPIIPVAIKYVNRDLPWLQESFLAHFMMYMGYWSTKVEMHFGAPISGGDCRQLLEKTQTAIDQQLRLH